MRVLQVLFLSLFIAAVAAAGPAPAFLLEPSPSWIDHARVDADAKISPSRISYGTEYVLRDDQIRAGTPVDHYSRRVVRIVNTAGLQNWQEIEIDYDPSYQTLVLHHARVLRGDASIDALEPDEIRTIQRETDLAERIYDGRMTALLFLHDLRPGDVIDYAWSVRGSNPILKGAVVDTALLALTEPARRIRWRLLHQSGRRIATRIHHSDARITETKLADGWTEKRIDLNGVEPLLLEDSLPPWLDPWPRLEASEFADWNGVARWAVTLFDEALATENGGSLAQTVEMLRGRGDTDAKRALAAIRFVQDEIRYLGIEAGAHSHRPHAPATVLARRFGDCKDKALLLTELLGRLGFKANVALVDSTGGRELPSQLPSPFVFDHAIAVFEHEGKRVWVDATISNAGGTLETMAPPRLEKALVVDRDTNDLASLQRNDGKGLTRVVERWTLEQARARFNVETTYSGRDADSLRSLLSSTSLVDLGRQYRDYYSRTDPDIEPEGLPEISDDRERNRLIVREKYIVPDFWSDGGERELWAHVIGSRIAAPSMLRRTQPFVVGSGGRLEHEIEVSGGSGVRAVLGEKTVEHAAFRLRTRSWREQGRLRFRSVWEAGEDTVAPAQLTGYAAAVQQAEEALSLTIASGGVSLAGFGLASPSAVPAILAGGAAAACGAVGLTGLAISRRRRGSARGRQAPRVASMGALAELPEAVHCGRTGVPVSAAARTVGSDPATGAPVVSIAVVCPECLRAKIVTAVIEFGPGHDNSAHLHT